MGNIAMRTILALLLLSSIAYADKPAELEKALARNRSLLVIKIKDVEAANAAAVVAFGPANSKMFSAAYCDDGSKKETHYVASVRMTSAEKEKFLKAFDALLKAKKIYQYEKPDKDKMKDLKLETVTTAAAAGP
jgi:hypothetical protein